jgi:Fe-S-cluster containining protein
MENENLIDKWRNSLQSEDIGLSKHATIEIKLLTDHGFDAKLVEKEMFSKIDCMKCANCCKTTPTIFTEGDISRICKKTDLSKKQFLDQIVIKDIDGTYTSRSVPCYFLNDDNSCKIYDFRPEACRSYPHIVKTNSNKMIKWQIRNTKVCPISYHLIQSIEKKLENDI